MIRANFSTYASYVSDSLNQWDINQVLQVTGVNLKSAPEVHFSNANTDRAIVRQATMENHVISADIPNSLLQEALRIYAHIGVYEGTTFKVVEVVEIPVNARKRPMDYQIEDSDEEIYSFKRLENMIANIHGMTTTQNSTKTQTCVLKSVTLLPNQSVAFTATVVGRDTASTDCASFEVKGLATRGASGNSVIANHTVTSLGASAGAAGWTVSAVTGASDGGVNINVVGENGKTIKWAMRMTTVEC